MLTQNLPQTARNYSTAQRREQQAAIAAVLRQWNRMSSDFDSSYARIAPTLLAIVQTAQARIALQAAAYIPAVLEETGQTAALVAAAQTNTAAMVGITGTGARVADTLAIATIRAKSAVEAGQTATQALGTASDWLTGTVGTIFSDTGRTIESVSMATRPVGGYVRMLNPPSCARCVVQAGKWFRKNQGFERHPECDCRHIPASEAVAEDIRINPNDYFDSLDDAGKLKLAGSQANLRALEDGADLTQIINAYRRTDGMIVAGVSPIKRNRLGDRYTTEGTTRRGAAGQQQAALRRNGPSQLRLMPASIYKAAKDQEDVLRLLRLYGWITDNEARSTGRDIFAEQRRIERNARARARRAERR